MGNWVCARMCSYVLGLCFSNIASIAYNLDFYTDVLDLRFLLNWLDAERLGLHFDEEDENGNQKLVLDEDTQGPSREEVDRLNFSV